MKVKRTLSLILSVMLLGSIAVADYARFTVTEPATGEFIVTDVVTGLIWQKSYVTGKTWQQALAYCEELDYANQTDWRLPDKNELASLINYEIYGPASDFPDMPSQYFWSSSSNAGKTSTAWLVNFYGGSVGNIDKTYGGYARCVRPRP